MTKQRITTKPDNEGDFLEILRGVGINTKPYFFVTAKAHDGREIAVEIMGEDALRIIRFFSDHLIEG